MLQNMKDESLIRKIVIPGMLLTSSVLMAEPMVVDITADEWSRPRSAEMLVQIPTLRKIILEFNRHEGVSLVVRYPGGEEGLLWANELKDWLVSLGIPSAGIKMQSGHSDIGKISLILGN